MKECQHCKACYSDEVNVCPTEGMPTIHTIAGDPVLEGKYHLESRVGQGGMGVVYKARHAYLKTLHAIKVILPDLVGNDPQLVQRFQQEALAAAAIRHPNVVNVTDYGVAQGTMPFLVMEFVEGEDLHDYLAREKVLAPEVAFEVTRAMCSGIGAAHSQGIVHRDMKPLNIMLLSGKSSIAESVKILDFGLAKIKSGELLGSFIQAQTTGMMGSPYYMAPEQWSDDELDPRSDIYSIGVMLYQMLSGDVPFKGASIPAIMKKHLTDAPPSFAERGVSISPQLEGVVMRTLEKERELRTSSVEVLVDEFAGAIGVSMHATLAGTRSGGIASLRILTNPPNSNVFLNNVDVGFTSSNGWITLEGVQSGNHKLRVAHTGFEEWQNTIFCDGTTKEIVAHLNPEQASADAATQIVQGRDSQNTPTSLRTPGTNDGLGHTTTGKNKSHSPPESPSTERSRPWYLSPLVVAVFGISALLLLTAISGLGLYFAGAISSSEEATKPTETSNGVQKPAGTNGEAKSEKPDLVAIPGGTFTMGRNEGSLAEQGEHQVTVKPFFMDKTEVTNGEYHQFLIATGRPAPAHFVNGAPVEGKEMVPVNFVSLEDARAFADWRSKRDGKKFRLPTEEEWEFAARGGSDDLKFPWGNSFDQSKANIGKKSDAPKPVASFAAGANKWGVVDLIGNVWEWTDSRGKDYPNSPAGIQPGSQAVRGGGFYDETSGANSITSTFRGFVAPTKVDESLGFRLVTSDR